MISLDEAQSIVMTQAQLLGEEDVDFRCSLGRILAQPVIARTDSPLFDNSAVDGFGVRAADAVRASEDTPVRLSVVATVKAGETFAGEVRPGSAAKVLTGSPIPPGVELVVMREFCEECNGEVVLTQVSGSGDNIRRKAEEFSVGDEILPAGTAVTPPVVGLLAASGHTRIRVYKRPRISIIVTGDELVEPGGPLHPGRIYDSNSYSLSAAIRTIGIADFSVNRVGDDPDALEKAVLSGLQDSDVVITIGGVSVGDYDFVKDTCIGLGVDTLFWKVALKPGKPNYFGAFEDGDGSTVKLVFGLPGNPVSALVSFHQLVKPALLKMMGANQASNPLTTAVLASPLKKKPGRLELVRAFVSMEQGQSVVKPSVGQDSHMLGGLARANCLIHFPAEAESLVEGETVTIEMLNWRCLEGV